MKIVSIDGHPRLEELADYVSDALASEDAARLETHVFDCALCADRLQHAASFQMLMHDAAAAVEAETIAPRRGRRHLRVGAVGGFWAAAAALVLMVCQQGGGIDIDGGSEASHAVAQTTELAPASFIEGETAGSEGLLASLDPLQSIDPLQTWPDDPEWDDEVLDGEPCGSGEDGGPLVCQPFSG